MHAGSWRKKAIYCVSWTGSLGLCLDVSLNLSLCIMPFVLFLLTWEY